MEFDAYAVGRSMIPFTLVVVVQNFIVYIVYAMIWNECLTIPTNWNDIIQLVQFKLINMLFWCVYSVVVHSPGAHLEQFEFLRYPPNESHFSLKNRWTKPEIPMFSLNQKFEPTMRLSPWICNSSFSQIQGKIYRNLRNSVVTLHASKSYDQSEYFRFFSSKSTKTSKHRSIRQHKMPMKKLICVCNGFLSIYWDQLCLWHLHGKNVDIDHKFVRNQSHNFKLGF